MLNRILLQGMERLADLLPKAAKLRRGAFGRNTRAGLDSLLGSLREQQRERILAGVIRHRLINRSIFVAHSALPTLAKRIARLVPIVGTHRALLRDASAPLIIASGHFGPLFFATAVLERVLQGRRVIVVLREGARYLPRVVPMLDSLGFESVTRSCGSSLVRALREDRRTVVIFAFDAPVRAGRCVPFLDSTVATSSTIARLADLTGARVVTSFWLWRNMRPHIALDHAFEAEGALRPFERRKRIVDALYEVLESYVLACPEQWSGWDTVFAAARSAEARSDRLPGRRASSGHPG